MRKLYVFLLLITVSISGLLLSSCKNNTINLKEIEIADATNGCIVLRENLIWMPGTPASERDFFEAVPDNGYYFEKWVFLDKEYNQLEYELGANLFLRNFVNKSFLDNAINIDFDSNNPNYLKNKDVVYISALFTNDESKLVDVNEPELEILAKTESIGEINYKTNTLPDKKVGGTLLWKYVVLENESLYIPETFSGVGSDGSTQYVIRTAISDSIHHEKGTYAYLDYEFIESFNNRVEWISISVDIVPV